MNSYHYSAGQCGLNELPPGELRLAGFERTDGPDRADVFVIPCDLKYMSEEQIHKLPFLEGNEARHVVMCISDLQTTYLHLPFIAFRADCNKFIMQEDPSTIAWPWPVKDLGEWVKFESFEYDVCFVGWNSTPLTDVTCAAVQERTDLKSFIHINPIFYGTWESNQETEKLVYHRKLFLDTMNHSRLSLCARSIAEGVVRYRFYEAMSTGRIPVHFNDNAYLPFQSKIDWEKCSIHIPEKDAINCGTILREWLDQHSDEDIIERGLYGRRMWAEWLNGADWDLHFAYCVKERLAGRL